MTVQYPNKRFVRLHAVSAKTMREDGAKSQNATVTFTVFDGQEPPNRGNNGTLANLASDKPEFAGILEKDLAALLPHQKDFFDWIEANPNHVTQFTNDPLQAIATALPTVGPEMVDRWGRL